MPRFTIAHHAGSSEGDHYDLLLESGEALRTWRLRHTNFENQQTARKMQDHRKKYLEYEGEISGGRGRVKIWDTGTFEIDLWTDKLIQVSLFGAQAKVRLRLQCGGDDAWTVVDAAAALRRLVAHHLRHAELDASPTSELDELRAALTREEQKLLAFVRRYSQGEAVEWTGLEFDAKVRDQVQGEWVRWRHPWLDQAREFVDRVDGLLTAVREAQPGATEKTQPPKA